MSKIHAILLVPEDGDPHGLLKCGPCGAMPPMLCERWPDQSQEGDLPEFNLGLWTSFYIHGRPPKREALVLAWNGKFAAEGMDRAARVWESVTEDSDRGLQPYNLWWCRMTDAVNLGSECEEHGIATVILIDENGQEITSPLGASSHVLDTRQPSPAPSEETDR